MHCYLQVVYWISCFNFNLLGKLLSSSGYTCYIFNAKSNSTNLSLKYNRIQNFTFFCLLLTFFYIQIKWTFLKRASVFSVTYLRLFLERKIFRYNIFSVNVNHMHLAYFYSLYNFPETRIKNLFHSNFIVEKLFAVVIIDFPEKCSKNHKWYNNSTEKLSNIYLSSRIHR